MPDPADSSRNAWAIPVGALLGGLSTAWTIALPEAYAFLYLGVLLGGFGFVYAGFAVAHGTTSSIAIQSAGAAAFVTLGVLGAYEESHVVLGLGFLAHAGWDWWHHDGHGPTPVRTWYPPFCAVADIVIGIPVLAGVV